MRFILVILCCLFIQACSQTQLNNNAADAVNVITAQENIALDQQVHHVVLVWLKEEYKEQLPALLKASKQLAQIPGVVHLKAGPAISSERAIVDDSFDLGVWITFQSVADMDSYLKNKKHQAFLGKYIRDKVHQVRVYDF